MRFLPIVLIAGVALFAFMGAGQKKRPQAPARRRRQRRPGSAPQRRQPPQRQPAARPRQQGTIPRGCSAILLPSGIKPEDCPEGTCPLRNAQAAELSTVGDLAEWVECAAGASGLSRDQVAKGIVGSEQILNELQTNRGAWQQVRNDIRTVVEQQGASKMPGSASIQYVGADGQVRTVQLQRAYTGDLQLVYSGDTVQGRGFTGWRLWPQYAAYGTAYW